MKVLLTLSLILISSASFAEFDVVTALEIDIDENDIENVAELVINERSIQIHGAAVTSQQCFRAVHRELDSLQNDENFNRLMRQSEQANGQAVGAGHVEVRYRVERKAHIMQKNGSITFLDGFANTYVPKRVSIIISGNPFGTNSSHGTMTYDFSIAKDGTCNMSYVRDRLKNAFVMGPNESGYAGQVYVGDVPSAEYDRQQIQGVQNQESMP